MTSPGPPGRGDEIYMIEVEETHKLDRSGFVVKPTLGFRLFAVIKAEMRPGSGSGSIY